MVVELEDEKYIDGVLINTFSSLDYDLKKFHGNYKLYITKKWDKLPERGNMCFKPVIKQNKNDVYSVTYFMYNKSQNGKCIKLLARIIDEYKLETVNDMQILKLIRKRPKLLINNNVTYRK